MKSSFEFSNLLGTVYRRGNLVFHGDYLLSPVGNRVSCFDLVANKSFTFAYEHRKNIDRIAINKQGTLLMSVDEDGRAILVNFHARTVLHHFNFKEPSHDIQFSPCGRYFAVGHGRTVTVWHTPNQSEDRQFAPFVKLRDYAGHYTDVLSITWSQDSRFFLSTSKDLTARLWSLHSEEAEAKTVFAGHRDYVLRAFFNKTQEIIYTLSKDGAVFKWEYLPDNEDETVERWQITEKNFLHCEAKVRSGDYSPANDMLVVGFTSGEFRLYELGEFNHIQSLSMGQHSVDTVKINESGEWLAFGSSRAGQLVVYEWQSESYILKQQGHYDAMNCVVYSPDGSRVVTGSDDGKIKVWDVRSGFCLYTFSDHQAPVTSVQFAKRGQVLFSSSLDGTCRAYDLIRFRNFRTFTATERVQFSCVAVDPSGTLVCAGSQDTFEVHVWSVQTAQLLDSLTGHEGPVSCLAFGQESTVLASASWDKTVRVWDLFGRSLKVEPIEVSSDVLALAMRPDSKEVAVSSLDGHITTYDLEEAQQTHQIDGRRDIIAGRYLNDRFEAKNSARSKFFTCLQYSFDGLSLVAGGTHNSICMYDVNTDVMVKRFVVSENMTLDGTLQKLNSSKITDAGTNIDTIDVDGENSDMEDRIDTTLPGSHRGDPSARNIRPEVKVLSVAFSPTSSAFVAASTEGLLVYSVDDSVVFDPFDLDVDVTPESVKESLTDKEYLPALVMAFRLNEPYLIQEVFEAIPVDDIALVADQLPVVYLDRMLKFIGGLLRDDYPHLELALVWVKRLITTHGRYISNHKSQFRGSVRLLQRFLARYAKEIVATAKNNQYLSSYLLQPRQLDNEDEDEDVDINGEGEDEEDEDEDVNMDESDDEGEWIAPKVTAATAFA
ncbi:hypothetical protein DIURU_004361 [Diutina rugosa]|uniref:Small-subunit processome Utp12 domain-containing protein n=1 Tax=Diutina rugosa TaxID=5481 RepID=A0A642UPK9_DIURU|nr:uncharacterized protein DIURU_004361 [Diutina rugosa]KAA8899339.1 hypothetical protein DIURU_004361 [Diutina rugosa]